MVHLDDYLTTIVDRADRLATEAVAVGSAGRPVPTCPGWTLNDLIEHLGMVHRWAGGNLLGGPAVDGDELERVALAGCPAALLDRVDWLRVGVTDLIAILRDAAEDVDAMVFLPDAPAPRLFWARRQAHETTIHAADGTAARLGRPATAAELGLSPAFAADGIDELVTGFLPRRRSRLRSDRPYTVVIRPTDVDLAWTVRISADPPAAERAAADRPDATWTGTAAGLYLALWNRGAEIIADGAAEPLNLWRRLAHVTWA